MGKRVSGRRERKPEGVGQAFFAAKIACVRTIVGEPLYSMRGKGVVSVGS